MHALPENTGIVVRWDFRYYPVVYCAHHTDGYVLLGKKTRQGYQAVSYRTQRGAHSYLLRNYGDRVVCGAHKE